MHVHHLALRTPDMGRLERFYLEVVGLALDPDHARGASVWLLAGTTRVMLEPRLEGEPGVAEGTMDLVAFVIEAAERERCRERLRRHGVSLEQESAYTLYFRDPDGRRVALSHYPEPRLAPAAP